MPRQIDTLAIVGVGLIGGSIGLAVRERRLAARVVGVGRRAASLAAARRRGAIDRGTTDLERGVAQADIVIVCTSVDRIAAQLLEAAEFAPEQAILTDCGSTKKRIVDAIESVPQVSARFVGSHPLAGSEKRGVAVARADLFDGRVTVVTPTDQTPTAISRSVERFWRSLGSHVIRMPPEEHDRALAYTSHLPHLVAAALSIVLPAEYNDVVATGYRDTTRIAASDPELWTAIFLENAESLLTALDQYDRTLEDFRDALNGRDAKRLQRLWADSFRKRQRLDS